VRWETEWPFDGQLCCEYVNQKLLKLDNPSLCYGKKIFGVFFMPHTHSVYICQCLGLAVSIQTCCCMGMQLS